MTPRSETGCDGPGRLSARRAARAVCVPALLLLALLAACGPGAPPGWKDGVVARRERLNAAFAGPDSPLAPADRARFTGLSWFPPDPAYIVEAPPDRAEAGRAVELLDTQGAVRHYRIDSVLRFRLEGKPVALTVYAPDEGGDLFLPFRDATAGSESYAAGRYVEVEPLRNGLYRVDFNNAYNPYCAYDSRWSCPVVPDGNVIDVAIRAGEKAPAGH